MNNYQFIIKELSKLIKNLWKYNQKTSNIFSKGNFDIVTETDLYFEKQILKKIKEISPNIPILSEETLSETEQKGTFYTVDPVDGTWNYANGIPIYGTQLALIENNFPILGLIYLPVFDLMFTAIKDQGAYLNNKPIHVIPKERLKSIIAITDFRRGETLTTLLNFAKLITQDYGKPRMNGCSGFDLAMVSCGAFQGKVSYKGKLWDIAPGAIIIKEAGGMVTIDENGLIAAASQELYMDLLNTLNTAKMLS